MTALRNPQIKPFALADPLAPVPAQSYAQSALWVEAQDLFYESGDLDELEELAGQAIDLAGECFPRDADAAQLITTLKNQLIERLNAL
jgi:hypothetical protein